MIAVDYVGKRTCTCTYIYINHTFARISFIEVISCGTKLQDKFKAYLRSLERYPTGRSNADKKTFQKA